MNNSNTLQHASDHGKLMLHTSVSDSMAQF